MRRLKHKCGNVRHLRRKKAMRNWDAVTGGKHGRHGEWSRWKTNSRSREEKEREMGKVVKRKTGLE